MTTNIIIKEPRIYTKKKYDTKKSRISSSVTTDEEEEDFILHRLCSIAKLSIDNQTNFVGPSTSSKKKYSRNKPLTQKPEKKKIICEDVDMKSDSNSNSSIEDSDDEQNREADDECESDWCSGPKEIHSNNSNVRAVKRRINKMLQTNLNEDFRPRNQILDETIIKRIKK